MSKKSNLLKAVVFSSLIVTSSLVFGQAAQITRADIDRCDEGLSLLFIDGASATDLKYKYPADPKTTWVATYAQFKKDFYPVCDKIIKNYKEIVSKCSDPNSPVAKAKEAVNAACKANPIDYKLIESNIKEAMKEAVPSILIKTDLNEQFHGKMGIVLQGDRIGPYCPKLHRIQFDCIFARDRVTNSTKAVKAVFEELRKHITN